MIRFTILSQPVSHKNGYRIVTLGKRPAIVKSKQAIGWERDALMQIPPAARQRLEGPVSVTIRLFYASERPDMDESLILDIMQDRWAKPPKKPKAGELNTEYLIAAGAHATRQLLQAGVYRNDRQVREKHVFHGIDRKNPRAEIEVEALQAQQQELIDAALAQREPGAKVKLPPGTRGVIANAVFFEGATT